MWSPGTATRPWEWSSMAALWVSQTSARACVPKGIFFSYLKSWPNGTPNSSQLEPSYKIKICIGGWSNDTAKWSQLARNHSIVGIRPRSHTTITKQLGESWLELTEVAKRWKTWLELGKIIWGWSNSNQLEPTQAKWVAKRYPTPSKLLTCRELAWVWKTVWPGLKAYVEFPIWDECHRISLQTESETFLASWVRLRNSLIT